MPNITDMLLISVVEAKGLKVLVRYMESEYMMQSRATVTNRIEKHFEKNDDKSQDSQGS